MLAQTAYQILTKYITNPILIKHSLAAEAAMRALAIHLNEDIEEWGITGLLHDADYEKCKDHPEKHGLLLFKLEPNSIPSVIEHAIKSHNFEFTKVMPQSKMEWAIVCCDELTGIIFQLAQEQKDKKISTLTPEIIIQKLNDKNFAKETNKKNIFLCEEKLGIKISEFIQITLAAMQQISPNLGL